MWLLKLHFAVSVLCLLTVAGIRTVMKDTIKNNGYESRNDKRNILNYWIFFIPILNLTLVVALFVMIGMKKDDLEKIREKIKD